MLASRRLRYRRALLVAATIVTAAALLYGTVVALYAADERSRLDASCEPPPGEVALRIEPESVDALHDRVAITVDIVATGPLELGGLGFAAPVTIGVNGTDGDRAFTIAADTIPPTVAMSLIADGRIEQWPLDAHVTSPQFVVVQSIDGEPRGFVPYVCAEGQVSGWSLAAVPVTGSDDFILNGETIDAVQITATRSPATVAFGLVLLLLMTALPVLGLTVSIAAFRGRRKVEATLMSWMAAMLFAIVPLRGFLPGSPPVGSWVDYLVVLWVVGGLVAGLVVYVAAWLKWTPAAGERPRR